MKNVRFTTPNFVVGPLNQVMELWSYQDLNQRAHTNPRWGLEYMPRLRPHLIRQEIRLLNEVRAPKAPVQTPNIYECCRRRTRHSNRARPPRLHAHFQGELGLLPDKHAVTCAKTGTVNRVGTA
jgi:hypothetical protein